MEQEYVLEALKTLVASIKAFIETSKIPRILNAIPAGKLTILWQGLKRWITLVYCYRIFDAEWIRTQRLAVKKELQW